MLLNGIFENIFLKKYLAHYTGLSAKAWQGIVLGLTESTLVGVCYFLSLYFIKELNLSLEQVGLLMGVHGVGTILGGIVGGKITDTFSSTIGASVSLIIQALAYFFLAKTHNYHFLIVTLFLLGLGSYGFITSNYAFTLSQCSNENRLKAINLLTVGSNFGLAISGVLYGFVSTNNFTFIFFTISLILFFTAIYFLLTNSFLHEIKTTPHLDSSNTHVTVPDSGLFYFVLFCLFIVGNLIFQTSSTYSIYLLSRFPAMGNTSFSYLLALNAILVVLLQAPIANHFNKTNKIFLVGMGGFFLGFGMFLLNFAYSYAVAVLSCLIMTFGEILFFSTSHLICYENAKANKKGQSLGIYRVIYALSRVTAPVLGSFIYEQYNSYTLWNLCLVLGVICFTTAYFFNLKNFTKINVANQ